ncbi:caa(3)-type oxidase subunit IV [Litorivivens lipolytica]|uniref:Caa(3)-type oxidase subunit IV n=1 Tax=Litorivivens lipolytica TaxID=1524264 RepID=A0A7W4W853_9GAMM|nr:cytochrome C oxidase subunit IV family protein [Litorivivens lipolytica]MBB3048644.1 caa(3)-type oxidase subunit IV [Litorivivens lipolytica]
MSNSTQAAESHDGQEHPIGLYFKVWTLLFVLSALSYMVDYFQFQGLLRWSLILLFMFLKAGLIIAVFMHFAWEPATLKVALLLPTLAIVVFIIFIAIEADYIYLNRLEFLAGGK